MKCESLLKREVSCLFSSILDLDKASKLNKYQRFVSLFVWFAMTMCDWVIVIRPIVRVAAQLSSKFRHLCKDSKVKQMGFMCVVFVCMALQCRSIPTLSIHGVLPATASWYFLKNFPSSHLTGYLTAKALSK